MRNGELNIKDRLGEVRENNFGTPMKIIKYRKASDLDVQFLDEHRFVKEHITYSRFKLGQVKIHTISLCMALVISVLGNIRHP